MSERASEEDLKYSCSRVIDGLNRYRELAAARARLYDVEDTLYRISFTRSFAVFR